MPSDETNGMNGGQQLVAPDPSTPTSAGSPPCCGERENVVHGAEDVGDEDDTDPDLDRILVSAYTRSQALAEGTLIDVSNEAKEVGIGIPVALTRAVWTSYVKLSPAASKARNDERGRLHDILWMFHWTAVRFPNTDTLHFELLVVTTSIRPSRVTLKAMCGPGDDGEPVITILLPEED